MLLNNLTGISNNYTLIGYILLFPIFFLWLIGIIHTTIDITRRTNNLLYEIFCILLSAIFGPLGWLLYLVIRPTNTLEEINTNNIFLSLTQECLSCGTYNSQSFKYCSNCGKELKTICKECKREYYKGYNYCPYCDAPNLDA